MGWTFYHREKGQSHLEAFKSELGEGVLDCAQNGNAVYIAYRLKDTQKVIGVVCLIRWVKNDYYNFGYKDMDEGMGPCETNCPAKILALLSPVDECYTESSLEYARAWRKACSDKSSNRRKMAVGSVIKWAQPLEFSNGCHFDTLRVQSLKPLCLVPLQGYGRYRVTRDVLSEAEIVE